MIKEKKNKELSKICMIKLRKRIRANGQCEHIIIVAMKNVGFLPGCFV